MLARRCHLIGRTLPSRWQSSANAVAKNQYLTLDKDEVYMIQLQGITKSFGSLQVLRGIDLNIDKGEIVSIVGPSGAGKTTLLQIMGTLDALIAVR